jgi:hypothetical protein
MLMYVVLYSSTAWLCWILRILLQVQVVRLVARKYSITNNIKYYYYPTAQRCRETRFVEGSPIFVLDRHDRLEEIECGSIVVPGDRFLYY